MKWFAMLAGVCVGLVAFTFTSKAAANDFYNNHHSNHHSGHHGSHHNFGHGGYGPAATSGYYVPNYGYGQYPQVQQFQQPSYNSAPSGYYPRYQSNYAPAYPSQGYGYRGHHHVSPVHIDVGPLHFGIGGHH